MKADLTYDKDTNCLHQVLHGNCKINELAEYFKHMSKFDLQPSLKILSDITDAELAETNYNSISYLEKQLDIYLDKYMPIKKAIIAESDLEFGIARMYQILSEKDHFYVKVFHNKAAALDWLLQP